MLQSGLTSAIAAGIASVPFLKEGAFFVSWLRSWAIAWVLMIPLVLFAAPAIRRITHALTRED